MAVVVVAAGEVAWEAAAAEAAMAVAVDAAVTAVLAAPAAVLEVAGQLWMWSLRLQWRQRMLRQQR